MASSDDEDQHQVTLAGLQGQLRELGDTQRMHANRLDHTENTLLGEVDSLKHQIQSRNIFQEISSVDVHLHGSKNATSTTAQGFAVNFHQHGEETDADDSHGDGGKQTTEPEDPDPADRGRLEDIVGNVDLYSSFLLNQLPPEQIRELVGDLTSTYDNLEKSELVAQLCNNIADEPNVSEEEPEGDTPSPGDREESPKINKMTSSGGKSQFYGEEDDFKGGSEEEEMDLDEEAALETHGDRDGNIGESPPISPRSQRPSEPPSQEEHTGIDPQVKSHSIDGRVFDTYNAADN